jgi:hypothetical protein
MNLPPDLAHTAYSRFMKYSSSNWQTSFVDAQDLLSRVQ